MASFNIVFLLFFCILIAYVLGKPMEIESESDSVSVSKVIKILPRVRYDCSEGDLNNMELCKIDGTDCCQSRTCTFKPDLVVFPRGSGSCSCVCDSKNWDEHDIRSFAISTIWQSKTETYPVREHWNSVV